MSHTFDSGLAAPMRTLIANAAVAKLLPLKLATLGGAANGFLEDVFVIGFAVEKGDSHAIDMLWDATGGRSPVVVIAPSSLRKTGASGIGHTVGDLDVDVMIVSTHRRSVTEGRATTDAISTADDSADPGIFATLELVWAFLFDVDLGLGGKIAQLKFDREYELDTHEAVTIWKQEWKIQVERNVNLARGITQKFLTAHTTLKQSAPTDEPAAKRIIEDTTVG